MKDKSKELTTSLKLINDRLHFEGEVEGNSPISIDYIPPFGDNLGYTSLELMMMSLSSCLASALLVLLRRQGKNIESFSIKSEGTRSQIHPTALEEVHLYININSDNLETGEIEKVISMSESICPVWHMIKDKTRVIIHHQINQI